MLKMWKVQQLQQSKWLCAWDAVDTFHFEGWCLSTSLYNVVLAWPTLGLTKFFTEDFSFYFFFSSHLFFFTWNSTHTHSSIIAVKSRESKEHHRKIISRIFSDFSWTSALGLGSCFTLCPCTYSTYAPGPGPVKLTTVRDTGTFLRKLKIECLS